MLRKYDVSHDRWTVPGYRRDKSPGLRMLRGMEDLMDIKINAYKQEPCQTEVLLGQRPCHTENLSDITPMGINIAGKSPAGRASHSPAFLDNCFQRENVQNLFLVINIKKMRRKYFNVP